MSKKGQQVRSMALQPAIVWIDLASAGNWNSYQSEGATRVGLEPSALRYYESIDLLPKPERMGGKRRYDESVLLNPAVIQRARRTGFTLEEIRQLFFGFKGNTPASRHWQKLWPKETHRN